MQTKKEEFPIFSNKPTNNPLIPKIESDSEDSIKEVTLKKIAKPKITKELYESERNHMLILKIEGQEFPVRMKFYSGEAY